MTRLLFDTTFLIDADRSGSALDEFIDDEDDVAISAVTIAELGVGVALSTGRSRKAREAFFADVEATIPSVDYDSNVAKEHRDLLVTVRRQGRQRGAHDLIIAATARATGRTVVSADESAFDDLPGVLLLRHR
ncbi:MAG TPA: PIN domain-containing protein [Acidimicrobiales bacterium]|nr:PIN domain-containing protein [Acidimicrobiales bacterium]